GGGQGHMGEEDIRLEADELCRQRGQASALAELIPPVDDEVLSFDVAKITKPLAKGLRRGRVGGGQVHDDTDARQLCRRLRFPERGRQYGDRASEKRTPARHRMTSSARASTDGGMVRPSAFAVLRLITSSNFVGCSTGRSLGFAPLKILSTYVAARR